MNISFDTERFKGNPNALTAVLSHMKYANCWVPMPNREIESITCTTPSATLKFCRYVNNVCGVSRETEKIFLKNASLGIRYLRVVRREKMQDEDIQKRFWKKVTRNPELALEWSRAFNKRLSETEEEVFVKSMRCMGEYASRIIRGRFPEKIHHMIVLKSFETLGGYDKRCLENYMRSYGGAAVTT